MSANELGSWLTVFVGLILAASGVRASFYFGKHRRALNDSWVITAFYRTVVTITIVGMWLTLARALTLGFGPQPYLGIVSGLMIIWLLLIPQFLVRLFQSYEGEENPMDRSEKGQTLVEYGLLLALIAVIVIVALLFLGPVIADLFSNIGIRLNDPNPPAP